MKRRTALDHSNGSAIQPHHSQRAPTTASSWTECTCSPASKPSRHHAEPRHPGTADAAHRHARAGLRERNGPNPTRGARATCPATSQRRVGRRRRGSDERRRTLLFARELLVVLQRATGARYGKVVQYQVQLAELQRRAGPTVPSILLDQATWATPRLASFARMAVGCAVRRGLAD